MSAYGFQTGPGLFWRSRTLVDQVYVPYPNRGAFSGTYKTGSATLTASGRTLSATTAAVALGDADGMSTSIIEFVIQALGTVIELGIVAGGAMPTYGGGFAYLRSNGTSSDSYIGGAWSVGDFIGVSSSYDAATGTTYTKIFKNGVFLHRFGVLNSSLSTAPHFYVATNAAGSIQVTAESFLDLMHYGSTYTESYGLSDWPLASPYVDPPATAITLSPSTASVAFGVPTTFTVTANGALSGTVHVTSASDDGTDTVSAGPSLTNSARSGTFTVTPTASGTKHISVTNDGSLTNPSFSTLTVAAAASASTFDSTRVAYGSLASTNHVLQSAGTSGSKASAEGLGQLRQGATTNASYAVEFTLTALPSGAVAALRILSGTSYSSSNLDPDISSNLTTYPYFKQDGAWGCNSSDGAGSSSAWAAGDKIGCVMYDFLTSGAGSSRVAWFRNGTLIGKGATHFSSPPPVVYAILSKTNSASAVQTTVQGDIASMTYGATYQAFRDSSASTSMIDAVSWPQSNVPPNPVMANGVTKSLVGDTATPENYYLDVPAGYSLLRIEGNSAFGGAHWDAYVKRGSPPTTTSYDSTFDVSGKSTVDDDISSPAAGRYYILIVSVSNSNGSTIKGTWS